MTAVLLGARQLCMAARKSLQSPLFDAGTAKAESHKNKKSRITPASFAVICA
jgi:hypothetical protein